MLLTCEPAGVVALQSPHCQCWFAIVQNVVGNLFLDHQTHPTNPTFAQRQENRFSKEASYSNINIFYLFFVLEY
jgi:hypothetical protein